MANKTSVTKMKNGQYIVTIPRAIAEAMRLKKKDQIELNDYKKGMKWSYTS